VLLHPVDNVWDSLRKWVRHTGKSAKLSVQRKGVLMKFNHKFILVTMIACLLTSGFAQARKFSAGISGGPGSGVTGNGEAHTTFKRGQGVNNTSTGTVTGPRGQTSNVNHSGSVTYSSGTGLVHDSGTSVTTQSGNAYTTSNSSTTTYSKDNGVSTSATVGATGARGNSGEIPVESNTTKTGDTVTSTTSIGEGY
jgi:hypothetical protein